MMSSSEGGGWSQVAEMGAGDKKAKIDGLKSGDRSDRGDLLELL